MAVNLKIKVKYRKLNVTQLVSKIENEAKSTMDNARAVARSVLIRNIGTQYFSLAQLHAMRHPYSHTGSGRPGGIASGIVNRQSGGFYQSFYVRLTYTGKRYSMVVGQTGAEQAQAHWLLQGTSRMRGRPWNAHLRSEMVRVVRPYIEKNLKEKLKLTTKAYGANSFPKG